MIHCIPCIAMCGMPRSCITINAPCLHSRMLASICIYLLHAHICNNPHCTPIIYIPTQCACNMHVVGAWWLHIPWCTVVLACIASPTPCKLHIRMQKYRIPHRVCICTVYASFLVCNGAIHSYTVHCTPIYHAQCLYTVHCASTPCMMRLHGAFLVY